MDSPGKTNILQKEDLLDCPEGFKEYLEPFFNDLFLATNVIFFSTLERDIKHGEAIDQH